MALHHDPFPHRGPADTPLPPWNALSLLSLLFAFFALFPYLRILPIDTDIQPNAMLVAMLIILLNFSRLLSVPKIVWVYLVGVILVFFIPGGSDGHRIRGVVSSLGFGVYFITWMLIPLPVLRRVLSINFLLGAGLIYLCGVLIQRYINPAALSPFMSREGGYGEIGGRGNESFAAEPTFLGIQLMLMMYVAFKTTKLDWRAVLFYLISLLDIFWGSKSSTVILTISCGIMLYCVLTIAVFGFGRGGNVLNWRTLISFLFLCGAALGFFYLSHAEGSRFGALYKKLLEGGVEAVLGGDSSVGDRFAHLYISTKLAFQDFFVPHGYGNFYDAAIASLSYDSLFNNITGSGHGRVMSCYGGLLFELGFIGFIPIFLISRSIWLSDIGVVRLAILATLTMLFFQSVQISHPLLGFVATIGYHYRGLFGAFPPVPPLHRPRRGGRHTRRLS